MEICFHPVDERRKSSYSGYYSGLLYVTYEVNGAEAPMADLVEVAEHLLRVIFEEEVGKVGVLRRSFPRGRWHGGLA